MKLKKNLDKLSLITSIAIVLSIMSIRFYWSFSTGSILSDEALYFLPNIYFRETGTFILASARHLMLQLIITPLTLIFRITNIFQFMVFSYVLYSIINVSCLYAIFDTLKRITENKRAIALSMISIPFIAVYTVMNILYLGEIFSLLFVVIGINLTLRLSEQKNNIKLAALSNLAFVLSYQFHEPFLTFLLCNILLGLYWMLKKETKLKTFIFYCLPLVLVRNNLSFFGIHVVNYSLVEWIVLKWVTMPLKSGVEFPHVAFYPKVFPLGTFALRGNLISRGVTTALIFGKGLLFGWTFFLPLLALGLVGLLVKRFVEKVKTEKDWIILLNSSVSVLTFLALGFLISTTPYLRTSPSNSICFRFSYMTLPLIFLLPYLYERIKTKHFIALGVIVLFLGAFLGPQLPNIIQSNQSLEYVNRIDFSYEPPYYRLSQYVDSLNGNIGVVADPAVRAYVYLQMTNSSFYRMNINETVFEKEIYTKHDQVLFYGEKWYGYWDTVNITSPFYYKLLKNQTGYEIEVVWEDGESHLYRVP